MERRKWRRGPRPTLRQPRPTCSSSPLGIHFPEKPVSPRAALPQAPSTMSRSSPPPRLGCRRCRYLPAGLGPRNPVRRGRLAGNACSLLPVSGASGAVVKWRPELTPLAANPIQFHSPPSALPVRARAPPRDPPSLPSPARLLLSLTPSAPALLRLLLLPQPPPPAAGRPVPSAFVLPSLHLLPQLPPDSRPRPLRREWPPFSSPALLWLTPSLASSLGPVPSPCRVALSLSRADVTTQPTPRDARPRAPPLAPPLAPGEEGGKRPRPSAAATARG